MLCHTDPLDASTGGVGECPPHRPRDFLGERQPKEKLDMVKKIICEPATFPHEETSLVSGIIHN